MRTLAVAVTCLSLCATAETLPPGTWKWTVAAGGGRAERVAWVLEGAPPPARRVVERWTLEVSKPGADGRASAKLSVRGNDGATTSQLLVWDEGGVLVFRDAGKPDAKPQPVVQRDAPPRVLSTERVPCTSPLLGAGDGLCAGVSGGPLSAPLFPTSVVVSEDEHAARDGLLSLAIGVMTGGFIIPGHTDTSIVATMDARPPPTLSPALAKWRKGAHTVAALGGLGLGDALDAETGGALLVLGGAPTPAVVLALAQRVPAEDRWPVLRLARQQRLTPGGLVNVVVALQAAGALGPSAPGDALEASALLGLDDTLAAGVRAVLAGRHPELRAAATRFGTPGFEAAALKALTTAPLEAGEGGALAALLSPATRAREVPRFLERLTDDEARALVKGLLENAGADERVRFFARVPKWVDAQLAAGRGRELLELVPFDDERALVINAAMARRPDAERPAFLLAVAPLFTFDEGRLSLLVKWKAVVAKLGVAQRLELLGRFGQGSEREGALALLTAGVERATQVELVLAAVATSSDASKVELLRRVPGLTLDGAQARKVLAGCTFDSGKVDLAGAVVPLVADAERAELLVDVVRGMTFDDGRLQVLRAQPELARRLDAAQRKRVLDAFTFERERGAALFGP